MVTGREHSGTAVLGIVHPSITLRVAEDLRSGDRPVRPIVLTPEIDAWRFEGGHWDVWTVGEEHLELDPGELTRRLREENVGEVVIPLGVPRRQLAFVARWARSAAAVRFTLRRGGLIIRRRSAVVAALWLLQLFVRLPTSVALRLGRFVDGALVVVAARMARVLPRRAAGASRNVVHVITHVGTGGAQRQLHEYLRWMATHDGGQPLSLVALYGGNRAFLEPLRATGIPVVVVEDRFDRTLVGRVARAAFPTTSVIAGLVRLVRESRPGCLYGWLFLANVACGIAGRLAGVPRVVASERTLNRWKAERGTGRWWYRPADRAAAGLWDAVVTNSAAAADDFAVWAGVPRDAIRVIPNGFDFETLLARPVRDVRRLHRIADDELLILTVGRLSPEKNHELLLRAAARVVRDHSRVRFVLVGHGPLERRLRERARELGIDDRVVFAGRVDDPESYYAAADLFVLTSEIESLPNALIEAQAFGVPAITTDVGGASEVVADGVTGLVVPVDDQRINRGISEIVGDHERRHSMTTVAAERVDGRFGMGRMAAEVDEVCSGSVVPGQGVVGGLGQ